MLSNFQLGQQALLQSFLIGQPELRDMMQGEQMQQLRQRVIASYHLGPMDKAETQAYIEHRLTHVGWKGDPSFDAATFDVIHARSGGVPRRINTLCNRLLLSGFLGEKHAFAPDDVEAIAMEIRDELGPQDRLPGLRAASSDIADAVPRVPMGNGSASTVEHLRDIEERMERLEKTIGGVVDLLHRLLHRERAGKSGASVGH